MLVEDGHEISVVGSHISVLQDCLPVISRHHVPSHGSGAIYAPARVNQSLLADVFVQTVPDLVIVESWQTALTDAAVDVASNLGLPILMISHGVSVHPYTNRFIDIMRALAWAHYREKLLPKRVSLLSALTTLDETSTSSRFSDRDLAYRIGVPVLPLGNSPINWLDACPERTQRTPQILVVGYFSEVKNQLGALQVMAGLPSGLRFLFIGQRSGRYYERCVVRATELGLKTRVSFLEDHECNLAQEIGNSLVLLSTSITEALPICLLEAMASGTPFVATPVGAVPSIHAGIVTADMQSQREAIISLVSDTALWNRLSLEGRDQYKTRFTRECVHKNLRHAVNVAMKRV